MYTFQKLIKTVFFPKFFILNCTHDLFSVSTNKYYNNVDYLCRKTFNVDRNIVYSVCTLFRFSV